MKLLHLDAGITGESSVSRKLSAAVTEAARAADPGLIVVRRDLNETPVPHLDTAGLGGLAGPENEILQEFLDADIVVIGAPMYNLGVPSQLKAWFDRLAVAGRTFRYTANGPEGLVRGKKVIVASARGGFYGAGTPAAALDFHETYIRAILAFIGVTDVEFVRAEGVAVSPQHRETALSEALPAARAAVAGLIPQAVAA